MKFGTVLKESWTKFHGMPVYDEKYIKTKAREFDGVIKTNTYFMW